MQITYTKQGDYYLPDLVLPETQNKAKLGKYAILSVNVKIKLIEKFKVKLIEFYQFF